MAKANAEYAELSEKEPRGLTILQINEEYERSQNVTLFICYTQSIRRLVRYFSIFFTSICTRNKI